MKIQKRICQNNEKYGVDEYADADVEPVTDGVDEDDGDEDARDKKLTSFSSRRRCYQGTSPPGIKRRNLIQKAFWENKQVNRQSKIIIAHHSRKR